MYTPRIIEIDAIQDAGSGSAGADADPLIAAAHLAFSSIARRKSTVVGPVIAVCSSDDARVDIVPLPASLSSARAEASATLAIEQSVSGGGHLCSNAACIWTDRADNQDPHQHLLAMAMPAATIDNLAGVAAKYRLRLQGVLPRHALLTRQAVDALDPNSRDVTVLLWFDRLATILAIADGPRLVIVRQVPIGLETFIDSLARTQSHETIKPVGRDVAQRWLSAVGVPQPEDPIPGTTGLRGSIILTALESALQRLALEARQSIRFAIPEPRRAAARLRLVGTPLRGLAGALSLRSALQVEPSLPPPTDTATIELAARRAASAGLLLRPRQGQETQERTTWRAALVAGAAIVLGLAAQDWAHNTRRRDEALDALGRLQVAGSAAAHDHSATSQQAALASQARRADHASQWLQDCQPMSSAITAIARCTPPAVTLVSIELSAGPSATHTVRGFASRAPQSDPTEHIRDFVERLRAVPVVSSVTLGAVRREFRDDQEVHAFELSLDLVEIPAPALRVTSGTQP